MPYYKIVQDDTILDAVTELTVCKYTPRSAMVLRCSSGDSPEGIICNDGNIYHVDGWPRFSVADGIAGEVKVTEIGESEYKELRERLSADEVIIEVAPSPSEPEPPSEKTMQEQLRELKADNDALRETNEMLTGCILEISEMLYG